MGTGPRAASGFDLALTELLDDEATASSSRSAASAARRCSPSSAPAAGRREDDEAADGGRARRRADGAHARHRTSATLLYRNLEHPRWDEVADRCLTCGNCTMVCPTCFCSDVEDVTDLDGEEADRVRAWESCFTLEHSYIHGGSVPPRPGRATASG